MNTAAPDTTERLGFFGLLCLWRKRAEERRTLARLTHCELRDFGVSRGEAIAETRKPFWQP